MYLMYLIRQNAFVIPLEGKTVQRQSSARKAKDYNGKPITTDNTGLLSTSELIPKGYRTWWACEKCESEDCFEYVIIDGYIDGYKCKKCGHTAWIPYAD